MDETRFDAIFPKTHEEWLSERNKGIGSSEVGTILGVNHFDSPYKLWRRKKGLDKPIEETLIMRLGHLMEDAVATLFAEATGAKIYNRYSNDWIAVDKERPYLRVSPDRIFLPKNAKFRKENYRILECKTTRLNIDKDNPPKYWWCQIQYQMYVLGVDVGYLAWIKNGTEFDYMEVERNDRFCEFMLNELDKFWNINILKNIEPDELVVSDTMAKYPENTDEYVKVDLESEAFRIYKELVGVRKAYKALDERKEILENKLKMIIGENEGVMLDGEGLEPTILATWKSPKVKTKKFEKALFEKEHPELYSRYCSEQVGARRFIFKE